MKTLLILFFMCFAAPFTFSQTAPIASYPFNGNANDISGNGNHGTTYNTTPTLDRFGNTNSAYQLNGSDSYIDIGTGLSFNSHSISLWVKFDSIPTSNFFVLFSGLDDLNHQYKNSELRLYLNGKPEYILGEGTSTYFGINNVNNTILSDTINWHHIVVSYSTINSKAYMYWDNMLVDSASGNFVQDANSNHYIGARPFWTGLGGTTFYAGVKIDDISIYNYAIPPHTVDSLYFDGGFTTGDIKDINISSYIFPNPTSGLIFLENFNAVEQVSIYDIRGNLIQSTNGANNRMIDISNHPPGVYMLFIKTSGHSIVNRLVKY